MSEYKLGMEKKKEKVIDYRDQTRQLVCSKVDTRATVVQNQLINASKQPIFQHFTGTNDWAFLHKRHPPPITMCTQQTH
jgi:hypothetical protein